MLKYGASVLALALAALSSTPACAATAQTATGVRVETAQGVLTVEPLSDRIVHVRFGAAGYTGNYNPAVIASPATAPFTVSESNDAYVITTAALKIKVAKAGTVSFQTLDGTVLAEEAGRDLSHGVTQGFSEPWGHSGAFYGLGQHQNGLLDYSGSTVHLQQANRDVAVPMLVSSKGYGILWNDAAVTNVDVHQPANPYTLAIRSEAGAGVDYDFIYGPDLDQVVGGYRVLTGDAPMMARWTWGLWQSKERYQTQEELLGIAAKYRAMKVPFDAVVQDWQYWQPGQWGSHKFDPARYPDPAAMVAALHAEHVHAIISVWARLDPATDNAVELDKAHGLFPKTYHNVYPAGEGRWYDAYNPAARDLYWRQMMKGLGTLGFDGWWLDASEAELGGNWGEMRDVQTAAGPGAEVFNAYPLMHTTAVHDGMVRDQPDKRALILTRSAYAGQQRNAAITWSGDTFGNWDTFRRQVPAALNFSLSGIPYWSADIGGFFGGKPKDKDYAELFTRWYQFGVFNPMFRVHGTGEGKELWAFDPATQAILVQYDKLRYQLLPYIYSTSWQVTSRRSTMMRALAFDFQDDTNALNIPDEYMFGPDFLVAPVTQPGADKRMVYLPGKDGWFDYWSGKRQAGGQTIVADAGIATIPLFVRAGSILPMGPVKPYADAPSSEPLRLNIYPGRDGGFELYDDAGDGYGYQHGQSATVALSWNNAGQTLNIGARAGSFPGMAVQTRFTIVCAAHPALSKTVSYSGKAQSVSLAGCR